MKKLTVLTLVIVLGLFVFAACGDKAETPPAEKKTDSTEGDKEVKEDKTVKEGETAEDKTDTKESEDKAEEEKKEGVGIGDLAMDFELKSFEDDTAYKLSDYRGKNPVIIKFFASWCGPCHAEMPFLNEVYEEKKDDGLVVLAVNLGNGDNETDVKTMIDDYLVKFPVLKDWESKVAFEYNIRSIPVNVFIDKDGIIRDKSIGMTNKEIYLEKLKSIMPDN